MKSKKQMCTLVSFYSLNRIDLKVLTGCMANLNWLQPEPSDLYNRGKTPYGQFSWKYIKREFQTFGGWNGSYCMVKFSRMSATLPDRFPR